jgi:hypothetical protein
MDNTNQKQIARSKQDKLFEKFLSDSKQSCTHSCSSCNNLFFIDAVSYFIKDEIITNFKEHFDLNDDFFKTYCPISKDYNICLCKTCNSSFKSGKIPTLNISNGFIFYDIPESLNVLTFLEQRFVSPRIPFMIIYELAWQKQFGQKGNLVNVPVDISEMITFLPREFNNIEVLDVKFMRRLKDSSSYVHESVRPYFIIEALSFLIKQPLYIKYNIQIDLNWIHNHNKQKEILDDDLTKTCSLLKDITIKKK